jgi:hypothetical protein
MLYPLVLLLLPSRPNTTHTQDTSPHVPLRVRFHVRIANSPVAAVADLRMGAGIVKDGYSGGCGACIDLRLLLPSCIYLLGSTFPDADESCMCS